MKKTIKSTAYQQVVASSFEVLIDPSPRYPAKPAIGLKVDPVAGPSFIMPIEYEAAAQLALMISRTLLAEAPELFHK